MAGDATGLAAVARLLGHPDVDGIQILKEKPVVVGVRRSGKWAWFFGPTAAVALAQAEKTVKGLPLFEAEGPLP